MGQKAREIIAYVDSEFEFDDPIEGDAHFWEVIRDEAIKRAPLPQPKDETHIRPMSDQEGLAFGRGRIGFGKLADLDYAYAFLTDPDYLDWLADQGMILNRWLAWRKSKL